MKRPLAVSVAFRTGTSASDSRSSDLRWSALLAVLEAELEKPTPPLFAPVDLRGRICWPPWCAPSSTLSPIVFPAVGSRPFCANGGDCRVVSTASLSSSASLLRKTFLRLEGRKTGSMESVMFSDMFELYYDSCGGVHKYKIMAAAAAEGRRSVSSFPCDNAKLTTIAHSNPESLMQYATRGSMISLCRLPSKYSGPSPSFYDTIIAT